MRLSTKIKGVCMENMPHDNYVKELGSSMSESCHTSIDVELILLFCLGWGFTSSAMSGRFSGLNQY